LLFCGKLIPKKRPLQLLEAYLAAGFSDRAQLLYVGEGELRGQIEKRAREAGARHVHLLGFFNQTQMPLAYVLGEVLCLISDPGETWGLVVNEAMACGRPVIVSDTVGCGPDLVSPENGWVVPLDDDAALRATLIKALEARERWPAMGDRGRERVAGHNFAAMAAGVQAAWRSAA
jgi:glycosyltransferase involved in cell wall biosynthesis